MARPAGARRVASALRGARGAARAAGGATAGVEAEYGLRRLAGPPLEETLAQVRGARTEAPLVGPSRYIAPQSVLFGPLGGRDRRWDMVRSIPR